MKQSTIVLIATLSVVLVASLEARGAIGLPDSESCSSNNQCLKITNTHTGGFGIGIYASSNDVYGLYGESFANSGIGVYGQEGFAGGVGVEGSCGGPNGTAVRGEAQGSGSIGVYGEAYQGGTNGVEGDTNNTGAAGVFGYNSSGGGYGVAGRASGTGQAILGDNTSSTGWAGYFAGRLYVSGQPYCNGANCGWQTFSDLRLKKNIKPLEGALDTLLKLRAVTFEWKTPEEHANQTGPQRGFIAQEVEKVLPEWVTTDENGLKAMGTAGFAPLVLESLRTLKAENDALRDRVKAVEFNKRMTIAGFSESGLFGIAGLVVGAFVVSRRKRMA